MFLRIVTVPANSHATSCIALSNKMGNDTTGGYCYSSLPGFNDLGRPDTPIFLLMDRFLYLFSTFKEKNEEDLSIRSLIFFGKMQHRIPFVLSLCLSVRRSKMPIRVKRWEQTYFYKI